jgi:L-lysine 6-transaminase
MVHEIIKKYTIGDGFPFVVDFENSHGSWFVDKKTGKEYLDCYSCHASQPLGWNYPKLETYREKLTDLVFHNISNSDLYSEPYAEFVEEFAKITPDFNHYFFISGGTLAVENALKAAFDWKAQMDNLTERQCNNLNVIHFVDAFHGRSGYTLSLTNTGEIKTRCYPKFNWSRVINPSPTYLEENIERNEKLALAMIENSLKFGVTAAIILEPIQGEGGDIHFRKEFFQELRKIADDNEVMLILDEIQTGFGLTGKAWCYEHFNIIPDLMCFGKKSQVCGFCSTKKIDSVHNNVFNVSSRINSTWGGNLLDMVRATIYLKIIKEDNLIENAEVIGKYFLDKLKELPLKNIRGRGLMIAFDVENRDEFYGKIMEKIFCLKCGEKSIRFRPHLTFSKEDADYAVKFLSSLISN